jgi:hypothetical protein
VQVVRSLVHDAPAGHDAFWRAIDDTLHIWVNSDLDSVARQRYITQARREHGLDVRRRAAVPWLIGAGGLHGGIRNKALAASVGGTAVAIGLGAMLLPTVLDQSDPELRPRQPAIAAPPPAYSTPPAAEKPKPSTRPKPASPRHEKERGNASRPAAGNTGGYPVEVTPPIDLPGAPIVETPPTDLPPGHAGLLRHLCVRLDLIARVRVGCSVQS